MKEQKKLIIGRGIFAFIVFVCLGVIVVTEKSGEYLIPRAKEKMNSYLEEKYKDEQLYLENVTYKASTYKGKVLSIKNKNHYFYVYYTNKKITDTYKKDYLEGKNLLNYTENKLKKTIKEKVGITCNIEIITKLNTFTEKVQERIITEDNLLSLKFYNIKKELLIDSWTDKEILKEITNFIKNIKSQNITPKYYKITITNKKDITNSIEISNLTEGFLNEEYQYQIINAIINKSNEKLLKQKNITYKYLNEGE